MNALAPRIDRYLEQLERHLGGIGNERSVILDDIRSHIHESLMSLGRTPTEDDLQLVLNELGDPAQIAAEFSANNLQPSPTQHSGFGKHSPLIFGALALATFWLGPIPFLFAILAIGSGVAILRDGPAHPNRASAWAGIVMAAIALILVFVLFLGPVLSAWFMSLL